MPSPSLLKILSIFVKLAYDVLKVGTVGEIEDEDNHKKYVSSKRQGKILRKLLRILSMIISLNTNPLEL